jgi:hypothetical protein
LISLRLEQENVARGAIQTLHRVGQKWDVLERLLRWLYSTFASDFEADFAALRALWPVTEESA